MAADQECLAHYPGSQSEVPLVRRQPARGVRQGNGAVPRRTIERRPKHRRSADLGSDVPQRAARATLRCAWRVRQSFPARDAHRWESVRPPRQSGGAVGDVVFDPDGTDHPWQVAARECSGRPATRPAAQCACARRERQGRQAAVGPRDAGGTSKESCMRQLSRADGSAGAEPRELRRDRPLAHDRCRRAHQRLWRPVGRDHGRRPGGAAPRPGRPETTVRQGRGRQDADLRDWPRARLLRRTGGPWNRARGRRRRLPLVVDDSGARQERAVSDEEDRVMIVTKKALSRRTILRGMGAAVALPLLDAMIPALTAAAETPANGVRRLGVIYHPNGVIYDKWLPKGVGTDFELSPTLAGLQPFKNQLTVVTGLFMDLAEALGDGGGDHSRACGGYLSGVHVRKSDAVVEGGISMDQIAARAFERDTQLSSLQLQMDDNSLVGSCDVGYSCAYSSTISWLTPTLPLMAENNPRVVFERLFGASDSTDPTVRAARLRQDRSILDSVMDRVKQLQRQLGAADNTRVNDYMASLRDIERRIQKTEEQSAKEV